MELNMDDCFRIFTDGKHAVGGVQGVSQRSNLMLPFGMSTLTEAICLLLAMSPPRRICVRLSAVMRSDVD